MQKDLGALTIEPLYMLGIDPSTWKSISAQRIFWGNGDVTVLIKHGNMVVKASSRGLISQQYLQLVTRKVRNLEYGSGIIIENIQGETAQYKNYFLWNHVFL